MDTSRGYMKQSSQIHTTRTGRRDAVSSDRVARSIFGDVPLTDTERRLLGAAAGGQLLELEQCVQENGNLNCRDFLGRTGLQLAVLGEHFEAIQYLLNRCSLEVVEECLLHAIRSESVKICDMFLNHPIYSDKRTRMQLEFQHEFYDQEENNASFSSDITPIVLAAQCNYFDIVHMLLQKGFTIQRPHHYFCYCTECSNHKTFDRFVHSKSRLNAYRGLASPAYMSLSCDDPIKMAFELSQQLQNLADKEKEYKSEYKSLCEQCKKYAVELLELCRSYDEVMAALHGGSNTKDMARINMAIKFEQKKFIANASCQEHLMSIWYAGVPWFQHQSFLLKLLLIPLGLLLIPLTTIVYVFLPHSKVGDILRSPFMKFMNYICSYTTFLVILFAVTNLETFETGYLFRDNEGIANIVIIFYILGMFWAECKQLWVGGLKEYFSQLWNYMDITMLALYTGAYAIEAVVNIKVIRSPEVNIRDSTGLPSYFPLPHVLAKSMFAMGNVMSFARIAYILPANETFGQLQISYGRMLQDVGKFIFIYVTVMLAFICGLTSLYSIIEDHKYFSNLGTTTKTLFFATFGMGKSEAPDMPQSKDPKTTEQNFLIEYVGLFLYCAYLLLAVVVLINMLIAMMSNTFQEIRDDEDVEWKFARAKLWISFIEEGSTLPMPFNIIPTPKSIAKLFGGLQNTVMHILNKGKDTEEDNSTEDITFDYKATIHKVILRYVHKMKYERKVEGVKDDIVDAKEDIIQHMNAMCSKLTSRMDDLQSEMKDLESGLMLNESWKAKHLQNNLRQQERPAKSESEKTFKGESAVTIATSPTSSSKEHVTKGTKSTNISSEDDISAQQNAKIKDKFFPSRIPKYVMLHKMNQNARRQDRQKKINEEMSMNTSKEHNTLPPASIPTQSLTRGIYLRSSNIGNNGDGNARSSDRNGGQILRADVLNQQKVFDQRPGSHRVNMSDDEQSRQGPLQRQGVPGHHTTGERVTSRDPPGHHATGERVTSRDQRRAISRNQMHHLDGGGVPSVAFHHTTSDTSMDMS